MTTFTHIDEGVLTSVRGLAELLAQQGLKRGCRHLQDLADRYRALEDIPALEIRDAMVMAEAIEAAEIHTGFKDTFPECLDKFEKAFSGPLQPAEEAAGAPGRNYRFELAVCADARKGGVPAQIGIDNGDLRLQHRGRNVVVECKRLYNWNNIEKNLRTARKQACEKMSGDDLGLVAVSITRPFSDSYKMPQADITPELMTRRAFDRLVDELDKRHRSCEKAAAPGIPAILFHFALPGVTIIPPHIWSHKLYTVFELTKDPALRHFGREIHHMISGA